MFTKFWLGRLKVRDDPEGLVFREIEFDGAVYMHMVQDGDRWRALQNKVMIL
jgi:hypothetical protein